MAFTVKPILFAPFWCFQTEMDLEARERGLKPQLYKSLQNPQIIYITTCISLHSIKICSNITADVTPRGKWSILTPNCSKDQFLQTNQEQSF